MDNFVYKFVFGILFGMKKKIEWNLFDRFSFFNKRVQLKTKNAERNLLLILERSTVGHCLNGYINETLPLLRPFIDRKENATENKNT